MPLTIGLDWGQASHAVCVVDEAGAVRQRFEVGHSAAGLVDLRNRLAAFGRPCELPIAIEVETSAGAVGLLHADCPVLFWPRLESALQDRYKRTSAACQWSRDRLRQMDRTGILGVRAVVAGHTPVPTPLALGNVYHIDTEGWNEGYFTFLDLESLRAWPREVVTDPAPAG